MKLLMDVFLSVQSSKAVKKSTRDDVAPRPDDAIRRLSRIGKVSASAAVVQSALRFIHFISISIIIISLRNKSQSCCQTCEQECARPLRWSVVWDSIALIDLDSTEYR